MRILLRCDEHAWQTDQTYFAAIVFERIGECYMNRRPGVGGGHPDLAEEILVFTAIASCFSRICAIELSADL